jgi:hypothetical protein
MLATIRIIRPPQILGDGLAELGNHLPRPLPERHACAVELLAVVNQVVDDVEVNGSAVGF